MTTLKARSRKFVVFIRWFSAGGDRDRSNIRPSTQIAQEPSPLDASRILLISRVAVISPLVHLAFAQALHLRRSNLHSV